MNRNVRTIASTIALCAVALPAHAGLATPAAGANDVIVVKRIDDPKAMKSDATASLTIRTPLHETGLRATNGPAAKGVVAPSSDSAEPVIPETPTKLLIVVALLCAFYVYPKQRSVTPRLVFR